MIKTKLGSALLSVVLLTVNQRNVAAYAAKDYAVRIKASLDVNGKVVLEWDGDTAATATYNVSRWGGTSWTALQTTTSKTYTDTGTSAGNYYEYQVERVASASVAEGWGYIKVGNAGPPTHSRGKLILLVDSEHASTLSTKITRLIGDLTGDGYLVLRRDIPRTTTAKQVRDIIKGDYDADPTNVRAVFIFGHVPVPYSGNMAPDGKTTDHLGAWPADIYYGEMNGTWSDTVNHTTSLKTAWQSRMSNTAGDGRWDENYLPSDAELQVGRVDFYDLTYFVTHVPEIDQKTEVQLLERYLDKNNNYRHSSITLPDRRALIADALGEASGWAPASTAWRRSVAAFGTGTSWNYSGYVDENAVNSSWWTKVQSDAYLLSAVYSTSGIGPEYIEGLGYSDQFATKDVKLVFGSFIASYTGDWDTQNNFLRAFLGSPTYTLAAFWDGKPHWFTHHMSAGDPIGLSALLSQNNADPGRYRSKDVGDTMVAGNNNWLTAARTTYNALLGDPTLRLHVVKPPSGVSASVLSGNNSTVRVTWTAGATPARSLVISFIAPGANTGRSAS